MFTNDFVFNFIITVTLIVLIPRFVVLMWCCKNENSLISYEEREARNEAEILRQASIQQAEQRGIMMNYEDILNSIYGNDDWRQKKIKRIDWKKEGF